MIVFWAVIATLAGIGLASFVWKSDTHIFWKAMWTLNIAMLEITWVLARES